MPAWKSKPSWYLVATDDRNVDERRRRGLADDVAVPSPVMVALVQSASTLPVFLLGLPSGALADILDRRRYFMVTQIWVAAVALLICAVVSFGAMTAPLLLALTFANGVGLAMRWPVFAAIVPELVPRYQLSAALALNGVAMNASRIIGPILAGAIIASLGSAYVFALNAVLSRVAAFLMPLEARAKVSALPGERFFGAMRVGAQYVRQSRAMHAMLLRVTLFFLQSTALLALLPLWRERPARRRRRHLHVAARVDGRRARSAPRCSCRACAP